MNAKPPPGGWTAGNVAELLRGLAQLDPDQLLTTEEIADRWGVSEPTVRRRITSGLLSAGNLGTPIRPRYRVRLAELLAYELNNGLPTRGALPDQGPNR